MAEVKVKEATRQVSLDDIKFNKDNALMAALSCIPLIGAVVFFVEKKDLFVRYYAAQFGLLLFVGVVMMILGLVPVVNLIMACLSPLIGLGLFILVVVGAMRAYKGERFDIPVLSTYALMLMNRF